MTEEDIFLLISEDKNLDIDEYLLELGLASIIQKNISKTKKIIPGVKKVAAKVGETANKRKNRNCYV